MKCPVLFCTDSSILMQVSSSTSKLLPRNKRSLLSIDRLPSVSVVLRQLSTWDKDQGLPGRVNLNNFTPTYLKSGKARWQWALRREVDEAAVGKEWLTRGMIIEESGANPTTYQH